MVHIAIIKYEDGVQKIDYIKYVKTSKEADEFVASFNKNTVKGIDSYAKIMSGPGV